VHGILINRIINLNEGIVSPQFEIDANPGAHPTVAMATGGAGFLNPRSLHLTSYALLSHPTLAFH